MANPFAIATAETTLDRLIRDFQTKEGIGALESGAVMGGIEEEYLEDLEPEMAVETSYYTGRAFTKGKTKSVEYEAHQEIQPEFERRFRESFSKRHRDLESTWEE